MEAELKSLYLTGLLLEMIKLMLEANKALLGTTIMLLVMQSSFRNSAYGGICWIPSSRRMLILIWEKVSPILSIWVWSFFPFGLLGKGITGFWTNKGGVWVILGGDVVTISIDLSSLDSSESSIVSGGIVEDDYKGDSDASFKLSLIWLSTSLPNLKVITTLTFLKLLGTRLEQKK